MNEDTSNTIIAVVALICLTIAIAYMAGCQERTQIEAIRNGVLEKPR